VLLHQRLSRLAEAGRTSVSAEWEAALRQAGGFARDGARLGT
jgi:hypothetical protein